MKSPPPAKNGPAVKPHEPARRVTLADVAEQAGVSRVAVCEVLNNRPNCWASEATRQRIRKAADDLGYRPNLAARALRSGVTRVIGIVAPGAIVTRTLGLTEAAEKSDYTVTLSSHFNDSESEDRVIRRLLDRGVDGLAVYPVDPGPHAELRRLVEAGFPVVTFDGANLLDFACDDISVDYEAVGRLQARHLLQSGRRRICLANAIPEARINAILQGAVLDELKRAGAPPPLEMRISRSAAHGTVDPSVIEGPMRVFLDRHRGAFDGVIGVDHMASLTIRLLLKQGMRVPEDVEVTGAGDSMLASYGIMPMTSVNTADDAAGAQAFGVLMDRISGRDKGAFRRLTSPTKLVMRESTRAGCGAEAKSGEKK